MPHSIFRGNDLQDPTVGTILVGLFQKAIGQGKEISDLRETTEAGVL